MADEKWSTGVEMKKKSRSWSQLPSEILQVVLQQLSDPADYTSFGAVCNSWKEAAENCFSTSPPPSPDSEPASPDSETEPEPEPEPQSEPEPISYTDEVYYYYETTFSLPAMPAYCWPPPPPQYPLYFPRVELPPPPFLSHGVQQISHYPMWGSAFDTAGPPGFCYGHHHHVHHQDGPSGICHGHHPHDQHRDGPPGVCNGHPHHHQHDHQQDVPPSSFGFDPFYF